MSWKSSASAGSFRIYASSIWPTDPISQTYHTISKTSIKTTLSHQQLGHPQLPGSSMKLQRKAKPLEPWMHLLQTNDTLTWNTLAMKFFFSGSCLRSAVVLIEDLPYPNVFGWLTCRNECYKIWRIPANNIHRLGRGIHARITPIQSPLQADVWETSNTSAKALRSNFSKISMDTDLKLSLKPHLSFLQVHRLNVHSHL